MVSGQSFAVELVAQGPSGMRVYSVPRHEDNRGDFTKWLSPAIAAGLPGGFGVAEIFTSRSRLGVFRGMHFQSPPSAIAKLVWVLEGSIVDVVVDMDTYRPGVTPDLFGLSEDRAEILYVPSNCAHGFLTTSDTALVAYATTGAHDMAHDTGFHHSQVIDFLDVVDPLIVSERDDALPLLPDSA